MKTLLIVEDEKMIRQGIKTMVQRSGVPVEVIIECNNGKMALEVLKEQKIDVMFTDIRMPQMDGIELVKEMQKCEHIPITVAISGYDDFSYAVEMLRNGVREYILKPIERDKITEILQKLNEELESKKAVAENNQKIGYQQLKLLMIGDQMTEAEIAATEKQYADFFYAGEFRVCCQNAQNREDVGDACILLENVGCNDIFIIPEEHVELMLKNGIQGGYIGVSGVHRGIRRLREAYEEALSMRKIAFCRNRMQMLWGEKCEHIPEKLIQDAAQFLTPEATMQRVQLLGTERTDELMKSMNQLFFVVKNGRVTPKQFEACIRGFLTEVEKTYKSLLATENGLLEVCKTIWNEGCVDIYEERLTEFVMSLHEKINQQYDRNKNIQKMRQAVAYVEEHFADDLNMAVVSNYISMNYSLFSYSFKQYTGQNFVNFLKEIRMREAKKLLAETDRKIIEISQEVGYDNEKHFMKIFKNTYSVSPSEYRRNMRRE